MEDLDDLTKQINNIANDLKNQNDDEKPITLQEVPQPKWYQIKDWFSRNDELLEHILLAIRELKEPVFIPSPPIEPRPPTIGPTPTPEPIPSDVGDKLDVSIGVERDIRTAVEGLDFVTGQLAVQSAGTPNELLHQFETYSVTIRATVSNTGNVYVGSKGVSAADGYILGPGEDVTLKVNALDKAIYINADVSGDGVSWIALI